MVRNQKTIQMTPITNKKNLFDWATSELSQDAFLLWLFANYDGESEEVRDLAKILLEKFLELKLNEDFSVVVKKQENKIDVLLDVTVGSKRYAVIIEDKKYSLVHNSGTKDVLQLAKYQEDLEKKNSYDRIVGIYYKTDFMPQDEEDKVKSHAYKIFTYKQIFDVYSEFLAKHNKLQFSHWLLNEYFQHLKRMVEVFEEYTNNGALYAGENLLPVKSSCWATIYQDYRAHISKVAELSNIEVQFANYNGQYWYCYLMIKGQNGKFPIMEFNPRLLESDSCQTLLECYGWNDKTNAYDTEVKSLVDKYDIKDYFRGVDGKLHTANYSRKKGAYIENVSIKTKEELLAFLDASACVLLKCFEKRI